MHQEGYMKSIGACYRYHCVGLLTKDLSTKVKIMETELKEWTRIAENARDEYYPLNSFTNKQLCLLRKELYNPQDLTYEVKFLFTTLLPCTPESDIIKAVQVAWQQPFNFPTSDETLSTHKSSSTFSSSCKTVPLLDKRQTLDLKQIQFEVLEEREKDLFLNMTEQGTDSLVALLVILRNRGKPELNLYKMLDQYDNLRLEQFEQNVKFEDICDEINELLPVNFFLKQTEETVTSEDKTHSTMAVSKPSSSIEDFSLSRYNYA